MIYMYRCAAGWPEELLPPLHRLRLPAGGLNERDGLRRPGTRQVGDGDPRAFTGHRQAGGAPDARAPAGDQRGLALQQTAHDAARAARWRAPAPVGRPGKERGGRVMAVSDRKPGRGGPPILRSPDRRVEAARPGIGPCARCASPLG